MAEKLNWTPINLKTSDKELVKLHDAEAAAQLKTDAKIRELVAAKEGCKPSQVKVGRKWGKLSFAVDLNATGDGQTGAVSL